MKWFDDQGHLLGQPDEWWPMLWPTGEYADYSYDATQDIAPGDAIVGLSLAVAPSGTGEVVASRLALAPPYLVTVWITGGVPGRAYLYNLIITTQMIRKLVVMIGQQCADVPSVYPSAPPVNPGFGAPITWGTSASQT